jgi:four helix bundle protein
MMMPYERWQAWQASHGLVQRIYQASQNWPKAELYGLTSQARRAAFSVPMNIAEGSAKRGSRELRRFLDIALGSLSEVAYCIRLARDLKYLSDSDWAAIDQERNQVGKLLWGLYDSVRKG